MSSSKRRRQQKTPDQTGYTNEYSQDNIISENGDILTEAENREPEPVKTAPVPRQARMELDRIGDILRRARQERGEALHNISDYLRIRPSFLSALEHSKYDELPADAYVIGFLRTYAAYLNLDGKGAIDMYRREMAGRRKRPQLSMPQPISEGRAPTFAIMIAAFIAAMLIYAVWYGFATSDRAVVSAPDKISEVATTSEPAKISETPNSAVITPVTTPAPAESAPVTTITNTALTAKSTEPVATTATKPVPAVAADPVKVIEIPAPATSAKNTETPAKEPAKAAAVVAPKKENPDESLANGIAISAPEPIAKVKEPTKTEVEPTTDEAPKQRIFGNTTSRPRIYVRTEKESWLLIADRKGNTVFDRIMKPGEIYNVPSIEGLTLTTGNGGGIVLNVDGADLPHLSAESRVVRAVQLDPDKLKGKSAEE